MIPPPKVEDIQTESIKKNILGEQIEKHKPSWPAEGKRMYHSLTRGWIANEIFRRVDPQGKTIGEFLDLEISKKLNVDVFVGCSRENYFPVNEIPVTSSVFQSVKKSLGLNSWSELTFKELLGMLTSMNSLKSATHIEGMTHFTNFNEPNLRKSETSGAGANCSARGLARVGAAMANKGELDGTRLMSEDTWKSMHDKATIDFLMPPFPTKVAFTQGGVADYVDERVGWYGWLGYGGSVFQWHPELKIGFGYTCTLLNAVILHLFIQI